MSAFLRLPVTQGSGALVAAIEKKKILKKKILCHFLFLRSLPDLSCDRFSVTRLPTLRHLVHPVPGARLFGVVVASDSLTSAGPVASLLSAQPVFDREHEEWVFFISLGRLTQRPVLTLSNLHEAFCSSQNKPWQDKPFCMQSVSQNVVF